MLTLPLIAALCCTPASEALAAYNDLLRVQPADRPYARYLSLCGVDPAKQAEARKIVRYWVNHLSIRPRLAFPVEVSPTLLRIDLRDYAWDAADWEKVVALDAYFSGQWIDPAYWTPLHALSGSASAILRADQFMARTCVEPLYSAFLNLPPTLADLKKAFGVQEADVERLELLRRGAVLDSPVALHNRQLDRSPTLTGYFWASRDVDASGKGNSAVDALFGLNAKAGEFIWSLPNGLQGYYLANAEGKQQAEAPSNIARDESTPFRQKAVVNARSCVGCHGQGLRPFDDEVSARIKARKLRLDAYTADPHNPAAAKEATLKLESIYLGKLAEKLAADQRQFASAVESCCGMAPEDAAKAFIDAVWTYDEVRVDLGTISRELGCTPAQATVALDAAAALYPTESGILTSPVHGTPIARDAWESVYGFAAVALKGQGK